MNFIKLQINKTDNFEKELEMGKVLYQTLSQTYIKNSQKNSQIMSKISS